MKKFRMDNTEGFTQEQLNKMNLEFEKQTANVDEYDYEARQIISEKILNKFEPAE